MASYVYSFMEKCRATRLCNNFCHAHLIETNKTADIKKQKK